MCRTSSITFGLIAEYSNSLHNPGNQSMIWDFFLKFLVDKASNSQYFPTPLVVVLWIYGYLSCLSILVGIESAIFFRLEHFQANYSWF